MCHCQSLKSREDFTRENSEGSPQDEKKARLDFAKKTSTKPDHYCKSILWMAEIKKQVWRRL